MNLKRSVETWRASDPRPMSLQSTAAIEYAFQDAKADILSLADTTETLRAEVASRDAIITAMRGDAALDRKELERLREENADMAKGLERHLNELAHLRGELEAAKREIKRLKDWLLCNGYIEADQIKAICDRASDGRE